MPMPEETREIAQTAAREAVREMMIAMGVDTSSPEAMIEMQKDFQSLRAWRNSVQTVQRQGLITAVGFIIVGVLGILGMHFYRQ